MLTPLRPVALLVAGRPSALLDAAGRALSAQDFALRTVCPPASVVHADALLLGVQADDAEDLDWLVAWIGRLAPDALAGTWVWTLARGAAADRLRAAERALHAALGRRGAWHGLPAVCASAAQVTHRAGAAHATLAIEIAHRLQAGAAQLAAEVAAQRQVRRLRAAPLPARCVVAERGHAPV